MQDVNARPRESGGSANVSTEGSFIERLSPQVEVSAPAIRQESTFAMSSSADAAEMADLALAWSIERYAKVTAHAEREPYRAELIWAAHGVKGKHLPRVLKGWKKRFQDDPALEAQWRELVQHHVVGN